MRDDEAGFRELRMADELSRLLRETREKVELWMAELEFARLSPDLMEIAAALPRKRGCRR